MTVQHFFSRSLVDEMILAPVLFDDAMVDTWRPGSVRDDVVETAGC